MSDGRYKLIRFYKRVDAWELYDMKSDPREMKNVYGQAKYKKVQARLEKLLKQEIDRLEDEDANVVLSKN